MSNRYVCLDAWMCVSCHKKCLLQERLEYGALVEKLGGQVLDRQHFDTECTHLVVGMFHGSHTGHMEQATLSILGWPLDRIFSFKWPTQFG